MINAVVTDIEGTTSSLAFVKDILFPYARARLPEFIARHWQNPEVRALLEETAKLSGQSPDNRAGLTDTLIGWIDQDRKAPPLKALQGLIWKEGYDKGDFVGHVYSDALKQLRLWHSRGIKLYVYSSGSVEAQKLLFGHTEQGDLTGLFSGFFDTRTGGKKETESYRKIARAIGLPAGQILFLSDIEAELDAAEGAGFQTIALARPGEGSGARRHRTVRSFAAIEW